jgi:hypothetical protein
MMMQRHVGQQAPSFLRGIAPSALLYRTGQRGSCNRTVGSSDRCSAQTQGTPRTQRGAAHREVPLARRAAAVHVVQQPVLRVPQPGPRVRRLPLGAQRPTRRAPEALLLQRRASVCSSEGGRIPEPAAARRRQLVTL